jgi:hypothetical protein
MPVEQAVELLSHAIVSHILGFVECVAEIPRNQISGTK